MGNDLSPKEVLRDKPEPGQLSIWWLGQAGFLLKGNRGPILAIDPYLSNDALRSHGIQRIMPIPMAPSKLPAGLVLISHWHADHLDPVTVRAQKDRTHVQVVGPPSCMYYCRGWGIPDSRLHAITTDQTIRFDGCEVRAVYARHMFPGALCEDAIGYLIDLGDVRIYHTGDTEYDVRLRFLQEAHVDIMLTCINGAGNNLDTQEAAWFASRVKPRLLIPMHIGMFDSDPICDLDEFIRIYSRLADDHHVVVPEVGKRILFKGWREGRIIRKNKNQFSKAGTYGTDSPKAAFYVQASRIESARQMHNELQKLFLSSEM